MIGFELWMPAQHWNGRLLSLGNGGFGGTIGLLPLAEYLRKGYAVTANDTGHVGSGTAWMQNPTALRAWGRSATHRVLGPVEELVNAYYGRPQSYAYFEGCSTGGAQAMEEAEFYPKDFNGIVAESPGMDYSDLMLSFLWGLKSAHDNSMLSQRKLELLHNEILKRCDAEDGLKDGLLGRPLACHVSPEDLVCKQGQLKNCLTPQEVKTAELIYQGPRNPRTGAQIYPGFVAGSESGATFMTMPKGHSYMLNGWTLIQGALAQEYAIPLLKNMVFGQHWDWTTFDWDHDVTRVDKALGTKIDSMDPDLQQFEQAGGKLVMVQGWDDPLNAATLPIEYRRAVIRSFARSTPRASATQTVDGFYRLFMAPGMSHCLGGDGPSKVDALHAVTKWVEQGQPPAQLIATKVNMPSGAPAAPLMRRPLCPYPKDARFIGGDPQQLESFRCTAPSVALNSK
jgi:feruloyl esterase